MENNFWNAVWKVFKAGGWFPSLVFVSHLILKYIIQIYRYWPHADMPLHFFGGMSIAFFVSGSYQILRHEGAKRSRVVLLELVLIVSLTATAAVFWEFMEFASDHFFATNLQGSLLNTMMDLIMGMLGATIILTVRAIQLHAGMKEVRELVTDMSG